MSKTTKVKSLLALKNIKNNEYAKALGLARQQALTTKYARNSFSSDDLIKLAELTDTELSFVDKGTGKQIVTFDMTDIEDTKTE